MTYSQTAEELLKRRKLKREALFRYLASRKIPVDPGGEKHILIEEIRKIWEKSQVIVSPLFGDTMDHTLFVRIYRDFLLIDVQATFLFAFLLNLAGAFIWLRSRHLIV